MKEFTIMKKLEEYTYVLEVILAVLLAIGIAIGLIDIVKYFVVILQAGTDEAYSIFKHFLAHTLLLVVGIELMLMLLSHSTNAILELVLFVIARKMLIYGETMMDMVLGTLAIAGVFAILKYLAPKKDFVARDDRVYSASTSVDKIHQDTGLDLPTNRGNTVGGLVCSLAEEACVPVSQGSEFESGDIRIKVVKATDGVIEKVMITKVDQNSEAEKDKEDTQTNWHY
ncbi:transporter associated domain-containing protein [Anoxynatronum buryatiense]|uniref:Transporter associated domain-containing protein n=1 Tax=Anoxynatronum buryatiense TaxID=489973 RepID=A0AA45WTM7_9CLOT|nr:transporter associated domain-containing protein [Anoxynatronum buryatiense]SMP41547.1 Transporter associated domain-containing protein [Anoxynatronum buryatiense]